MLVFEAMSSMFVFQFAVTKNKFRSSNLLQWLVLYMKVNKQKQTRQGNHDASCHVFFFSIYFLLFIFL